MACSAWVRKFSVFVAFFFFLQEGEMGIMPPPPPLCTCTLISILGTDSYVSIIERFGQSTFCIITAGDCSCMVYHVLIFTSAIRSVSQLHLPVPTCLGVQGRGGREWV
jgi:hypothetical protein